MTFFAFAIESFIDEFLNILQRSAGTSAKGG